MNKLILASGSPRRKEFLSYLGIPFSVVIPHADESVIKDEIPSELVKRLSKLKASIVAKEYPDATVIAADTVVSLNSEILGKPKNRDEAFLMIKKLQGKTHTVYTGTTIQQNDIFRNFVCATEVTFSQLDDELIWTYVNSGEGDDKAGAYALQGIASMLIEKVKGSVSTVIGLPICEVRECLKEFGIEYKAHILSAHRVPEKLEEVLAELEGQGLQVIIAGAGLAAHLPGVIASKTVLPVIGVPLDAKLGGLDALYSIVQMPKSIPVATVGIDNSYNAAMLAVQILALNDESINSKLISFRKNMKEQFIIENSEGFTF